jgi:hypothetical protein
MKKYLWAGLLGLSFLILPSAARAGCFSTTICCSPVHVDAKLNGCLRVSGCPGAQAGPWYLYWPLEAHFGPPAPTGYPYWPSPMTLPAQAAQYGHPAAPAYPTAAPAYPVAAPAPAAPVQQTGFQPVGYYQQAPSYWYSR